MFLKFPFLILFKRMEFFKKSWSGQNQDIFSYKKVIFMDF